MAGNQLWLVGSHSTKRKKPKEGDRDGHRLYKVAVDQSRCLLARLTVDDGVIVTAAADGAHPSAVLTGENGKNPLIRALSDDPHLAPFVRPMRAAKDEDYLPLPGKDNGFDIEDSPFARVGYTWGCADRCSAAGRSSSLWNRSRATPQARFA